MRLGSRGCGSAVGARSQAVRQSPPLCPAALVSRSQRRVAAAASRKRSPVSDGLVTVLKDELKIEKERYRTPDTVLEGPPHSYELEDRPNSNALLLTRSFGEEDIYVEVDLDMQKDDGGEGEEGEEDEDELALPPVTFTVNVVKGDKVLGFACETTGEEVSITHVSLNDNVSENDAAEGEGEDEAALPPYTGPLFTELDDTLQQAFTDYLDERGIDGEFGAYLMELVHDKLEVEYMNWLSRVQDFVAS